MRSEFMDSAKENIERLKRFQAIEIQTARLLGGWLPGDSSLGSEA